MKQTFYTPFLGPAPKPLKLPPPCDRRAFIRWFLKAAKYTANEIFEKPDLELTYMTGRRPQHAWWLPQIADATTEVSQMLDKHEAAITRIKDQIESFIRQGQQRMIPTWLAKNRSVLAICGHHEHYPGITEEQRWVVVGHFYIAGDGVCLTAFGTTIGFCPLATRDAALEVLGEFNGQAMQQQGRAIIDFMETHGHPATTRLMGFRFRKRLRIFKGAWINLSKSGASLSVGRRGAVVNISQKGHQESVGLPRARV